MSSRIYNVDSLLNTRDAAALLGVQPRTIRWYVKENLIHPHTSSTKYRYYFSYTDLANYARRRSYLTATQIAKITGLSRRSIWRIFNILNIKPIVISGKTRYSNTHLQILFLYIRGSTGLQRRINYEPLIDTEIIQLGTEIAELYNLTYDVIISKTRWYYALEARKAFVWVCAQLGISVIKIASIIARRVVYIQTLLRTFPKDPEFYYVVGDTLKRWQNVILTGNES